MGTMTNSLELRFLESRLRIMDYCGIQAVAVTCAGYTDVVVWGRLALAAEDDEVDTLGALFDFLDRPDVSRDRTAIRLLGMRNVDDAILQRLAHRASDVEVSAPEPEVEETNPLDNETWARWGM